MQLFVINLGDRIQMKKMHPCGCDIFLIKRLGSDVRVVCTNCSRDLLLPREKLEKMIKKILK